MRRRPPQRFPTRSAGAIVAAIVLAGCGSPGPSASPAGSFSPPVTFSASPEPSVGGLLIAWSGPIQVTDETGALGALPRSPAEVSAVAAGSGRIVAISPPVKAFTADALASPVEWQPIDLSAAGDRLTTLVAVSADGRRMAMVGGAMQADAFDLDTVDLPGGPIHRLTIPRGANGPPAWLDDKTVVVDVITRAGASGLAAIDISNGAVTDRFGPGIEASFSADGSRVALIADGGDVLVANAQSWRSGLLDGSVGLPGRSDQTAERVAISPDGTRVAVVRSSTTRPTIVEIWLFANGAWAEAVAIPVGGDGPATIAWLR